MSKATMADECEAHVVLGLVKDISRILAGNGSEIQGAVLADLVAIWLASHLSSDESLREELLNIHVATVRNLIPANESIILRGLRRAKKLSEARKLS